jgi:hypothetical protein
LYPKTLSTTHARLSGKLNLDCNPLGYFAEIEQAAFSPARPAVTVNTSMKKKVAARSDRNTFLFDSRSSVDQLGRAGFKIHVWSSRIVACILNL